MFRIHLIAVFTMLAICFQVTAQGHSTAKGASFATFAVDLSSLGGELYGSSPLRVTIIRVEASYNRFVANGLFAGGNFELGYQDQVAFSASALMAGPRLGMAFGDSTTRMIPYLVVSPRYAQFTEEDQSAATGTVTWTGLDFQFGAGLLAPFGKHLGLALEASYHFSRVKRSGNYDPETGNRISIKIGLAGLFFGNKKQERRGGRYGRM
jgi:hypothetical protein